MKQLKQSLHIRGDSLYCPLAFSLDTYGNCLTDCVHCYIRRLNEVWGKDLKPADIEHLDRMLHNGLKNPNPRSPLAWAIKQKKTLRFGNKADPFQLVERKIRASSDALCVLRKYQWPTVIETKFIHVLMDYKDILCSMKDYLQVMPIISPGFDKDWRVLEYEKTTYPRHRLEWLKELNSEGIKVGVNGEPFIPGYHTVEEFEEMLRRLKGHGIPSYNVYNLHLNAFVAKRLHAAGLDIEKIWYMNQDTQWRPILQKLLDLAKKYDIILGCPDFVNSGWRYVERSNTCCGVNVDNPCTWNVITWKRLLQEDRAKNKATQKHWLIEQTWDGVGSYREGEDLMDGKKADMFSLEDIK